MFDIEEIMNNKDNVHDIVYENIVKVKYLLDIILTKEYKKWYE